MEWGGGQPPLSDTCDADERSRDCSPFGSNCMLAVLMGLTSHRVNLLQKSHLNSYHYLHTLPASSVSPVILPLVLIASSCKKLWKTAGPYLSQQSRTLCF